MAPRVGDIEIATARELLLQLSLQAVVVLCVVVANGIRAGKANEGPNGIQLGGIRSVNHRNSAKANVVSPALTRSGIRTL